MAKISPKQDFMVNHAYFFYFVTWISLIFLIVPGVFTDILGSKKLKTLGGIHETRKKKLKLLGHPARPSGLRSSLRSSLRPSGPAGCPRSFNLFFCLVSWNHPRFQFLLPKNIREIPETIKKINETRSQQKKMNGFLYKT